MFHLDSHVIHVSHPLGMGSVLKLSLGSNNAGTRSKTEKVVRLLSRANEKRGGGDKSLSQRQIIKFD